jgi:D-sedoheptulose 7-phosphate isomerase
MNQVHESIVLRTLTCESAVRFAGTEIEKLQQALESLAEPSCLRVLAAIAERTSECLHGGGRAFFCGNGGSAADAQHLSAELLGKQNYDRPPAAGIALTIDTSALTALANDYGYDTVFSRQIEALGHPGDIVFGLSTSGRSSNVVAALRAGAARGLATVSFTGRDPRDMAGSDYVLAVPADETAKIQELHITCGHIIFAIVERTLFPREGAVG